jgi:hypothetical protein
MAEKFCLASHGLLIGWPVDELAAWLNANTPVGIHFVVVGDLDPQPEESTIIQSLLGAAAAGKDLVIVGHSKGAMLMFYLADALKAQSIRVKLVASIDPTGWGSNAPGTIKWAVVLDGNAGQWLVPDNADVWLNFYQDSSPGGGVAHLAPGNATTNFKQYHLSSETHLSIPNAATTRKAILDAVVAVAQQEASS